MRSMLVALAVLAMAGSAAAEPGWTPLQLSFGPGEYALAGPESSVFGLRLGLFAENASVAGVDLCLAGGVNHGPSGGLQWGTARAWCEEHTFTGAQLSLWNARAGSVHGFQFGTQATALEELRGVQMGFLCSAGEVSGIQVGLLFAGANQVTGFQAAWFAAANDLTGVSICALDVGTDREGIGNVSGLDLAALTDRRSLRGGQIAAIGIVDEEMTGIQAGGLMSADQACGLQLAGFCGAETLEGLQVGGIAYAGDLHGLQIAGLSCAGEVHGVQVGLINATHKLSGVQIGLLNLSREGGLPVSPLLNWAW